MYLAAIDSLILELDKNILNVPAAHVQISFKSNFTVEKHPNSLK